MEAYIILGICILIVFIFCPKKNINKYGLPICMIILALFFGCRNIVAVDDKAYIEIFNAFLNNFKNVGNRYTNIEMSYKLLCGFFGILDFNYKAVFLFYAIVSYTFLYLFLKKMNLKKEELLIFIMAFLAIGFFTYMTVMRQFLATTIALYAMTFLKEKKYLKCIVYILIASVFHYSALIMLAFIPIICSDKINIYVKIILPLLAIIIGKFGIFDIICNLILRNTRYSSYVVNESNNFYGGNGLLNYIWLLIYLMQFLFRTNNKNNEYIDILEKGQMIYFVIFFFTINSGYALRLTYYFLIFVCFLFITFMYRVNSKSNRLLIVFVIIISLLAFNIFNINNVINSDKGNFGSNDFSIDFITKGW